MKNKLTKKSALYYNENTCFQYMISMEDTTELQVEITKGAYNIQNLSLYISNLDIVDGARDYRLMTAQMKDAILAMPEYNRFSKGIFGWVGFQTKWLEYENVERVAGETKWNFWKLFLYSLEGIVAFSTAPLVLASVFGMLFCQGINGQYLSKTYLETKNRPKYIIKDTNL